MPTKAELQARADQLSKDAEDAAAQAAAAKEEAAKPRTADDVFEQLLEEVVVHIGNPPRARALYAELMAMKQPQPKPIELKPEAAHDAADGHTS